jgi:hypothetical protein
MGLSQIRGPLQCLLICREGSACILLILEDHCEVEMRECGVRPIRQGTAVARLGFVEMTDVMTEQSEIGMRLHKAGCTRTVS